MGDRTSWELVRRRAAGGVGTTTSGGVEAFRPRQEGYYITVIPRPQASLPGAGTAAGPGQRPFAKVCIRASTHEGQPPGKTPAIEIYGDRDALPVLPCERRQSRRFAGRRGRRRH